MATELEGSLFLLKATCCGDEIDVSELLQRQEYASVVERKSSDLMDALNLKRKFDLKINERHDPLQILRVVRNLTTAFCLIWDIRYVFHSTKTIQAVADLATRSGAACLTRKTSQNPWNIAIRDKRNGTAVFATERTISDDGKRRQEFSNILWFAGALVIANEYRDGKISFIECQSLERIDVIDTPSMLLTYEMNVCSGTPAGILI